MTGSGILSPLIPLPVLIGLGVFAIAFLCIATWKRLAGWTLRAIAAIALLGALANPSLQQEEREALSDIVIAVVDESASQTLTNRAEQSEIALRDLQAKVNRRQNTELRVIRVPDGEGDRGTRLMTALSDALAEEPRDRIAGAVLITDGRVHDIENAPSALPAPLHTLLTGTPQDWDRRVIIRNAPAFAILGEQVTLTVEIEDQGAAPEAERADLQISFDGGPPMQFQIPLNTEMELPLDLPHGGMNVLQFETPVIEGELTDRNNASVVQINGVRDRLRVLLVSGQPHPGERTWRNLLKSDSAVDLVHFTILRPPEKHDGVPVNELSLIAFPTRELFLEKIDDFDLIIFDRYQRRGILPAEYLANVANYIRNGGAVLIAAGPDYASADSIYRSPLGEVLPGRPSANVYERGFRPQLSEIGQRHPVTAGLSGAASQPGGQPDWGRWFRLIEVEPTQNATTVLTGPESEPLLMLERVGQGRVALLASDHAWLWGRGYEGGGPQLELLRRLAHWMMKEPELEEETLWVEPSGQTMRIIRRTIKDTAGEVTITLPDGSQSVVTLDEVSPGRFEALWDGPMMGLYRLDDGELETVIALGPAAPREFEETIATDNILAPVVEATNGGFVRVSEGLPALREVRPGRPASGKGWIGITPRGAYRATDITVTSLVPAWLALILIAGLIVGAWLREGRR